MSLFVDLLVDVKGVAGYRTARFAFLVMMLMPSSLQASNPAPA
jgi:hypothetical protein